METVLQWAVAAFLLAVPVIGAVLAWLWIRYYSVYRGDLKVSDIPQLHNFLGRK